MICLVTGGAGFIGSHLVDRLISDGHTVRVIDNESAISNNKFYWNDKAENVLADVLDYENTKHIYCDVDYVFHLAAQPRVQLAIDNPEYTFYNNVASTYIALKCSIEAGVKKFFLASTSAIYGNGNLPFTEDQEIDPLDPYSESKYIAELIVNSHTNIIDTTCARFFNVYGDRQPTNGAYATVVGIFMDQMANRLPLTVTGDGSQTRDFICVDDVVDAMIMLMQSNDTNGKLYNVGSGKSTSILEVANNISSKIKYIPAKNNESKNTLANIDKIYNDIGWRPSINLGTWISKSVDISY